MSTQHMSIRRFAMPPFPAVSGARCAVALKALAAAVSLALTATVAFGEEAEEPKTLPGFPKALEWTFNLDATFGAFTFGDSLYRSTRAGEPVTDLGDTWQEGSIKPALGAQYTLSDSSQLYAKASVVGERTYGTAPPAVGEDASSYDIEDLYIGWRSGNRFSGLGENALDFTVGRSPYKLGHGMLLYDGAAEGGTRGGFWTNARKAFDFAAIARFKPGAHTLEGFYLDKNDLPGGDTGTKLWGVNYEYAFGEDTTLGATYMKFSAKESVLPQRDGADVYDLRAFTAPFPSLKALSFELEYAKEDNGSTLDSTAWNALIAYQLETAWKPKISYRYAIFEGDDPNTSKNEGFDGLLTGFYDWGTWWQGEIAGEYFLSNSNLISHQFRVHAKPTESIGTGLIAYDFLLDHPRSLDPAVSSDKAGQELDWYMDWALNGNFTLSLVAAVADPGKAIEQLTGRTKTFYYGMFFLAYSY